MAKITQIEANAFREAIKENLEDILRKVEEIGFETISSQWEETELAKKYGKYDFFSKELKNTYGLVWSRSEKRFVKEETKKESKNNMVVRNGESEKRMFLEENTYNYVYRTIQLDEEIWERYTRIVKNKNMPKAYINSKMFEKFCDWLEVK